MAGKKLADFRLSSRQQRRRQLDLGITRGVWRVAVKENQILSDKYKGCRHFDLDGKEFDLKAGMLSGGKRIFPGNRVGCMCGWTPVVPGFDDHPPAANTRSRITMEPQRKSINLMPWLYALVAAVAAYIIFK